MDESPERIQDMRRMVKIIERGEMCAVDADDTTQRHQIERESRSERAKLQSKVLQLTSHVSPDLGVILQQLFLTTEQDLCRERERLADSWRVSMLKAQEAGIEQGQSMGYAEGYEAAMVSVGAIVVH